MQLLLYSILDFESCQLFFAIKKAWQFAILAGRSQLLSPPLSLTSVFGMGTGVSSATSSPDYFYFSGNNP